MEESKREYVYVPRVDTNGLISKAQIEVIRAETCKGDKVSFHRGENLIEGVVDKTYEFLFTLKDGRSFTWIEYILGSPSIRKRIKEMVPIRELKRDRTRNYHRMKTMRVD